MISTKANIRSITPLALLAMPALAGCAHSEPKQAISATSPKVEQVKNLAELDELIADKIGDENFTRAERTDNRLNPFSKVTFRSKNHICTIKTMEASGQNQWRVEVCATPTTHNWSFPFRRIGSTDTDALILLLKLQMKQMAATSFQHERLKRAFIKKGLLPPATMPDQNLPQLGPIPLLSNDGMKFGKPETLCDFEVRIDKPEYPAEER